MRLLEWLALEGNAMANVHFSMLEIPSQVWLMPSPQSLLHDLSGHPGYCHFWAQNRSREESIVLEWLIASCPTSLEMAGLAVGDYPHNYSLAPNEKGLLLTDLVLQATPSLCHFRHINYLVPGKALWDHKMKGLVAVQSLSLDYYSSQHILGGGNRFEIAVERLS